MKKDINEYVGRMFGSLEFISEAPQRGYTRYVMCKCHNCGRVKEICLQSLLRGLTKACGCGHRHNLVGKRFGKLEVIGYVPLSEERKKKTYWLCRCDCGNEKVIDGNSLLQGLTKTCGCSHTRRGKDSPRYKHGLTNSRIMRIWAKMKQRCYSPKEKCYKNYGGRGIRVCDEWINNFEAFYKWSIENGYSDNLTIDRIDVNGNYEPSNCRWVDRKTQCNNQRNNHLIEFNGKMLTISQIAEIKGMPPHVIHNRLYGGWDEQRAINVPYKKRIFKNKSMTHKK